MQEALNLARRGGYHVSPNPLVGCVIVKNDTIIARGWHHRYGEAHAEVDAIKHACESTTGATLYVNLEPCCHYGKTAPCTDAIVKAGISRVVCSMEDPNSKVAGNGINELLKRGVRVTMGVNQRNAIWLNRAYIKQIVTGIPYITYKMAMTLDGKIATRTGDSKWISSMDSRRQVHKMRKSIGNIMIGATTVAHDNPRLTARCHGKEEINLRIIIDGDKVIPYSHEVIGNSLFKTVIFTNKDGRKKYIDLPKHIEMIEVSGNTIGVDLDEVVQVLGARGINHIMCEGGSILGGQLLMESLIDEIDLFIAPKILGDVSGKSMIQGFNNDFINQAKALFIISTRFLGDDLYVRAIPKEVQQCSPVWLKMLEVSKRLK